MTERAAIAFPDERSSRIRRWRTGLRALRRLRDDVTDPYNGMLYLECFDGLRYRKLARALRLDATGRRFLDARTAFNAAADAAPEASLGHAYHHFMAKAVLEPLRPLAAPETDSAYLLHRMRDTHDLHHLVTGYEASLVGEFELQAFQFGNLRTMSSLIALAGSVRHRLPIPWLAFLKRLLKAWRRGKAAPPFHAVPWEEHWAEPLTVVRARFAPGAGAREPA